MLYVYGIVDASLFEVLRGEGHEGRDVEPVPAGVLSAAVSVLSAGAVAAAPPCVRRHEGVLQRLMRDHGVLPLRFGTICSDADTLCEQLRNSAEDLLANLARVRGKVEVALRFVENGRRGESIDRQAVEAAQGIAKVSNTDASAGRGTAYLQARLERRRDETERQDRAKRLEHLLRDCVGLSAREVVCTPASNGEAPCWLVSCLVGRDRISAFDDALEQFDRDHPQFDITRTGPWAPYSFTAGPALFGRRSW